MDLRIEHHWNDAVAPHRLASRSASPLPPVSDAQLRSTLDAVLEAPSRLTREQHGTHVERVRACLDLPALPLDQRADLNEALSRDTPEAKRKALVEFIRNHDGVIRWAASLRAVAESMTVP